MTKRKRTLRERAQVELGLRDPTAKPEKPHDAAEANLTVRKTGWKPKKERGEAAVIGLIVLFLVIFFFLIYMIGVSIKEKVDMCETAGGVLVKGAHGWVCVQPFEVNAE